MFIIFINVRLLFDQFHRSIDIQTCSNANFRVIIGKPRSSVPQ